MVVQAQDDEELKRFYASEVQKVIKMIVYKRVPSPQDAEAIIQDVCLRLWRKEEGFRKLFYENPEMAMRYAKKTAVHTVKSFWHRRSIEKKLFCSFDEKYHNIPCKESNSDSKLNMYYLQKALRALRKKNILLPKIYILNYYRGLTQADIAKKLGIKLRHLVKLLEANRVHWNISKTKPECNIFELKKMAKSYYDLLTT